MAEQKWFPIQQGGKVTWEVAEVAYRTYSRRYGTRQSLERLAERGGFGVLEFCGYYRGGLPPEARSTNLEGIAGFVLSVVHELGDRWIE